MNQTMYVLTGEVAGQPFRVTLEPGRHRIGRGSENDVDLASRSVSRQHAEILIEPDRIQLRDLGSSNGTWANGRPVSDLVEIRGGDRIRFGDMELTLLAEGQTLPEGPATISGLHTPEVSLSGPGEVSTQERLSWETASGEGGDAPALDQALFRAVTEAGQILVVPRPLAETFETVLGIVERVVPARRILLLLTDTPDGTPAIRAARPATGLTDEKLILSQTIIATVLRDREALLLNDVQSDPRYGVQESIILQRVRSAMVAPLFDNTQVIGLLYADSGDPRIHYDRNQLRAFTLLANLIAIKITNTRLLETEREKERMEQEIAAATKVQQSLLPRNLPCIAGYEILARQIPCHEVAGDLYDVAQLADGRVMIAVGDVTGKGMPAALLMSNAIACLRVLYPEGLPLVTLADRMHRELLESSDETHFVTLFVGVLDPRTHRIEYVNAGHNAPLLICGDATPINLGPTGMPLGLLPGATYETASVDLPPGCLLCVFSDGIPEAAVGEEFYGEERFFDSARKRSRQPFDEIADGIFADLRAFLGEHALGDDVTLLMLRRE
jgi:serine phosphatase RsbU (regulator of sigma subunit)